MTIAFVLPITPTERLMLLRALHLANKTEPVAWRRESWRASYSEQETAALIELLENALTEPEARAATRELVA